jgi:hypothetical protein
VAGAAIGAAHAMGMAYPDRVVLGHVITKNRADRSKVERAKCFNSEKSLLPIKDSAKCAFGEVTSRRRIAVIGDSHMMQWFDGLEPAARALGYRVEPYLMAACPPIDVTRYYKVVGGPYLRCHDFMRARLKALREDPPDIVVMGSAAYWPDMLDSSGRRLGEAGRDVYRDGLVGTARSLGSAGVKVVMVEDVPRVLIPYESCVEGGAKQCSFPFPEDVLRNPDRLAAQRLGGEVTAVNFDRDVCPSGTCYTFRNGILTYRDHSHLSATFSKSLEPRWRQVLSGLE